jgi:hypothetical protein
VEHRAQHRIHAAVPLHVDGVDAHGESFSEATEAIEVSRRGLSFFTRRDLPELSKVTVTLPGRGPTRPGEGASDFFSEAAVVRVQKEGDLRRVSVRFMGATLPTYTAETV